MPCFCLQAVAMAALASTVTLIAPARGGGQTHTDVLDQPIDLPGLDELSLEREAAPTEAAARPPSLEHCGPGLEGAPARSVHIVYTSRGPSAHHLLEVLAAAAQVNQAAGRACAPRLCFHVLAGQGTLAARAKLMTASARAVDASTLPVVRYWRAKGNASSAQHHTLLAAPPVIFHDATDAALSAKLSADGQKALNATRAGFGPARPKGAKGDAQMWHAHLHTVPKIYLHEILAPHISRAILLDTRPLLHLASICALADLTATDSGRPGREHTAVSFALLQRSRLAGHQERLVSGAVEVQNLGRMREQPHYTKLLRNLHNASTFASKDWHHGSESVFAAAAAAWPSTWDSVFAALPCEWNYQVAPHKYSAEHAAKKDTSSAPAHCPSSPGIINFGSYSDSARRALSDALHAPCGFSYDRLELQLNKWFSTDTSAARSCSAVRTNFKEVHRRLCNGSFLLQRCLSNSSACSPRLPAGYHPPQSEPETPLCLNADFKATASIAVVTLVSVGSALHYATGAARLGVAAVQHAGGTPIDLVVLTQTNSPPTPKVKALLDGAGWQECRTHGIRPPSISRGTRTSWLDCFTKGVLPQRLTMYSKVVYIDADCLVAGNISSLLRLDLPRVPGAFAAAPDYIAFATKAKKASSHFLPTFNAGVYVIRPNYTEYLRLMRMLSLSHTCGQHYSGDQPFLNDAYRKSDAYVEFSSRYNGLINLVCSRTEAALAVVDHWPGQGKLSVVHFTIHKPWVQPTNYGPTAAFAPAACHRSRDGMGCTTAQAYCDMWSKQPLTQGAQDGGNAGLSSSVEVPPPAVVATSTT